MRMQVENPNGIFSYSYYKERSDIMGSRKPELMDAAINDLAKLGYRQDDYYREPGDGFGSSVRCFYYKELPDPILMLVQTRDDQEERIALAPTGIGLASCPRICLRWNLLWCGCRQRLFYSSFAVDGLEMFYCSTRPRANNGGHISKLRTECCRRRTRTVRAMTSVKMPDLFLNRSANYAGGMRSVSDGKHGNGVPRWNSNSSAVGRASKRFLLIVPHASLNCDQH
jgi:hypothetical protein